MLNEAQYLCATLNRVVFHVEFKCIMIVRMEL